MTATATDKANRDRTYSITELCREFNVTPRTLRFYEQKGLLAPARRGWTRLFSYRDRARLRAAADDLATGKISGPVGTYSQLGPAIESAALRARMPARKESRPIIPSTAAT